MRCAIYCRISLDATGEQLGVTRQMEDCKALAASLRWEVVEVYVDNDISASTGKVRPDYQRMLRDIQAGEIEAVITWAPDRLYRKLRDLEPLIEVFETHGTLLKTVRGGDFDMATPLGRMIARILASVATGEGEVKSDRWKRSIRQRREQGSLPKMGPRLYGYSRDGDLEPGEVEHVRRLVDDLLDGVGLLRAAHNLNERGSRTTLGNEWSRASVLKYLRNGRIAGRSMLNGEVIAQGKWPAILDEETFEQVQQILSARRGTVPPRPRVSVLAGIIYCAHCGAKLITSSREARARATARTRTYRCSTQPARGGCGRINVTADPVEEVVEAFVRERATDPRVAARIEALTTEAAANLAEIVGLEARLVELEAQLDEPGVPVAAIVRAMDRTRERIETLSTTASEPAPRRTYSGQWPPDLARRSRLVRAYVEKVIVHPNPKPNGGRFDPERVEIVPRF